MVQPIAKRVAQNLEMISKNFQFSIRHTRILMGFIMSTMLLPGTNRKSHGQNAHKFLQIISRFCATVFVIGSRLRYDSQKTTRIETPAIV